MDEKQHETIVAAILTVASAQSGSMTPASTVKRYRDILTEIRRNSDGVHSDSTQVAKPSVL
jgi:hypothetical protein